MLANKSHLKLKNMAKPVVIFLLTTGLLKFIVYGCGINIV